MEYNIAALEYSAIGLGLSSFILNILLLVVLRKVRNRSEIPELKLIYAVVFVDLMLLFISVIQEVLAYVYYNPMRTIIGCQILGIFHTILPLGSLAGVTILSLNRFFFLYQYHSLKRLTIITFIVLLVLFICLCILCAAQNQFTYASSMVMCIVTPNFGWSGTIYYHVIISILILCWCCILFSYMMIILLKHRMDKSWVRNNQLDNINGNRCIYMQASSSITNSIIPLSNNLNDNKHNNSSWSLFSNMIKKQIPGSLMSKTTIKSLIIILIYTICLLPCIIILIYHSVQATVSSSYNLSSILSGLSFVCLFSLVVINPILMLCLHSRITETLLNLFQ